MHRFVVWIQAQSRTTRIVLIAAALAAVVALTLWARSDRGFLDAPAPDLAEDILPVPIVPASVIAAPIRIPLDRLLGLLDEAVPTTYGRMDERHSLEGRDRTEVAFRLRRDPFRASIQGDVATLSTTIRYALRAYYDPPVLPEISASCGTGERAVQPRITVALRAPLSLDRDWRLHTQARVLGIQPATPEPRDRCRMTLLNLDVTGDLLEAARGFMEDHLTELDSLATTVDVRSSVASWWGTLQTPIQLTDSLWLSLRPETVRRGPLEGSGDSLEIRLALRARPMVHYGAEPPSTLRELPPLESGDVAPGLDVRGEARVEYAAATRLLLEELAGRTFQHEDRTIRLDSLRAFGIGGGRMAVEVKISGDVAARLFLVGTPSIDPRSGRISIPDLDFDVATRNVVFAAASWLRQSDLRALLRERANWPAGPAVDWLAGWIETGLNRDLSDDLRVEGDVSEVRILGVYALQDALLVRVGIGGTARLFVAGQGP